MNLNSLIDWTKKTQDLKEIRKLVRKEADINICLNLLGELRKRCLLVLEHTQKARKYEGDVQEYLGTLAGKGVNPPEDKPLPKM